MTAPPWGHKPPAVPDVTAHWNDPPPEPSERCTYWVRRHRQGAWTPNRWIRRSGYYAAAHQLGIWIWEYWNVIEPLMEQHSARRSPDQGRSEAAA